MYALPSSYFIVSSEAGQSSSMTDLPKVIKPGDRMYVEPVHRLADTKVCLPIRGIDKIVALA